jgi:hypothetical protein
MKNIAGNARVMIVIRSARWLVQGASAGQSRGPRGHEHYGSGDRYVV